MMVELWHAEEALARMIGPESPLLPTARRAAEKLRHSILAVYEGDISKLVGIPEDQEFGWTHGAAISNSLRALESVLTNDMPDISCYLVSQKGIYRTEDLITRGDQSFPLHIRAEIPAKALKDFTEAGKCLAYEVPTACAFHLWRAVETVMDAYYKKLTSGKSFEDDKVFKTWAKYIEALNGKGADSRITQFLDHIRDEYRNPHTHPEIMLELDDALALFDVAKSAIHQMVVAIQKP